MPKQKDVGDKKKPYQVFLSHSLRRAFEELMQTYDPDLSLSEAIQKFLRYGLEEWWIPGYVHKEKKLPSGDGVEKKLDALRPDKTFIPK